MPRQALSEKSIDISEAFVAMFRKIGNTRFTFHQDLLEDVAKRMSSDVEWLKKRAGIDFSYSLLPGAPDSSAISAIEDLEQIGLSQSEKLRALILAEISQATEHEASSYLARLEQAQILHDPKQELVAMIQIGRDLASDAMK
jgi:hypothetical protein